ncbi:MAG: TonB-dependent hemoglobin/transferrin/lactoferrin family receptor [Halieaceae bacterium]|nr:TonB-dependent hemoglobin/transferrin/lactoferrin family receptor [Halieaceae bacterium]
MSSTLSIGRPFTRTPVARTLTALCLGLSLNSTVIAQQSTPVLENIVVTATRVERDLSAIGRAISVVDRDEIESIAGQSVADVLRFQPNISVEGGPRAGSQTVNIRGLGGNKVLQTVDGARLSFESGHRPSYYLDPELLRNVEALRGPASSLWGSGALGGVIAQNTLEPTDLLGERALGGFVRSGFNGNNDQLTTTVALAGQADRANWLVSGYFRDSDDVELGNGDTLQDSATEDHGVLAKVNWAVAEHHDLQFNVRANRVDGSVPANGTAEPNDTSNFLLDRDSETVNASVRWDYDPGSELINSRVLAYWNSIDIDESRLADGRADNTQLDEYGINLMNVSEFGWATLALGADIYREDFEAERSGTFRPAPPQAITDVWSAYAKAEIPLAAQWRMDLGLRYDDFTTEADNLDEERSADDTSMSAALVWTATEWATLALRYDEAFRAPTAEELYTTGTHFCIFPGFCNGFVPNAELEPEQAANVELVGQFNFTDTLGADRINLQASVFQNEVDNFIEQVVSDPTFGPFGDAGTTTYINVDQATLEGFELQGTYQRNALVFRLAYGQTRGEDDNSGGDLTNIPADTLVADLSYGFLRNTLFTGVRVTDAAAQRRTDFPENQDGSVFDSYTVTDLYASWQPASVPGLKLDLNINNLEDEFYTRAWDQVPEAGREVILFARYSF